MFFSELMSIIQQTMPIFRVLWVSSLSIGVALLFIAFLLKRNSTRKSSPWVFGIIGLLTIVSASTQLLFTAWF